LKTAGPLPIHMETYIEKPWNVGAWGILQIEIIIIIIIIII